MKKVGFFYQTSHNPCAVEMNLKQLKKHFPESPIVVWEDISNLCEDVCKKYNVSYKKVYRLPQDITYNRSQPVTEITGGLMYLNRIYISLMSELCDVDWFIHMEDDVWLRGPIKNFPTTEWAGCFGRSWDEDLLDYFKRELNLEVEDCTHGACGGTIISRKSFIEAYLKIQDIDWINLSKLDKYVTKYSDAIIACLLLHNKCKWSNWIDWSQGGYEDFKKYETPIVHNIKYWYNTKIEDLDTVNNRDEVKFFLQNNDDMAETNKIDKNIYNNLELLPEDLHGWNGNCPIFKEFISSIKPSHIIEVGTWKGMSAINMANIVKELNLTTKITCVDTWLGAIEFWTDKNNNEERNLKLKNGYPQIYYQFLSNVVHNNAQDIILPFPTTSIIAARYFKNHNIKADLIYIDGSHDFEDVYYDVLYYYNILNIGGIIFGDDIHSPIVKGALIKACEDLRVDYNVFDSTSPNYNFWYIKK